MRGMARTTHPAFLACLSCLSCPSWPDCRCCGGRDGSSALSFLCDLFCECRAPPGGDAIICLHRGIFCAIEGFRDLRRFVMLHSRMASNFDRGGTKGPTEVRDAKSVLELLSILDYLDDLTLLSGLERSNCQTILGIASTSGGSAVVYRSGVPSRLSVMRCTGD